MCDDESLLCGDFMACFDNIVVYDRVRPALAVSRIASICDKLDHKSSAATLSFDIM